MKVLAVTGGKGGVGKTTVSVNMAIALAKMGKKVLIFDADLGLANVDVMLGLKPKKTIYDLVRNNANINDVCIKGPAGIQIIPSASGIQELVDLDKDKSIEIIRSFSALNGDFDYMIVDLAAGISKQVIDFTHASQHILLVVCNEPSSIIDSYAVVKILHQSCAREKFGVIVNKVKSLNESHQVYLNFQHTVNKFMNVNIEYVGYLPNDDYIKIAALENVSVVDKYQYSPSSLAFMDLAKGVVTWSKEAESIGGIQFFFEKIFNIETAIEGAVCEA